jgi:DNA repair protein RecO
VSYQKTICIVINKKQYKETDLIITVLSDTLGKTSFIAKGANNSRSSRVSSLQLGNLISVQLYQKNDIYWLSEVKTVKNFIKQSKNLNQVRFLFFFLEVLNKLIAQEQHIDGLFEISQQIIISIEDKSLNRFIDNQIKFLDLLGFGIPQDIATNLQQKKYIKCQKQLVKHFESIIEKPLLTIKFT